MKESYFTHQNLAAKTAELLATAGDLSRNRLDCFVPARSALLVLDMQEYFLEPESHAFIPSAEAIFPVVSGLIRAFHEQGRPVILTRHHNTPENAGMMGKWWHNLLALDDPQSEISALLAGEVPHVLTKTTYDAFFRTDLEVILRGNGVSSVVIVGVMTHLCCETTARSAFVRGFEVFFPVDATATYMEAFHRATILNLSHGFASIVRSASLIERLRRENAG